MELEAPAGLAEVELERALPLDVGEALEREEPAELAELGAELGLSLLGATLLDEPPALGLPVGFGVPTDD